jgi:hypothetical protein
MPVWGGLRPRRRTLLAAVALPIAAGAVTGIVAALTGGPAVTQAVGAVAACSPGLLHATS